MNLLKYYTIKQCEIIFNHIEQSNFRIFKSIDIDGLCRQNKRQITTPEKLYKFIHQCKNPQKLYVSISAFLNPHKNHGFFANQRIETKDRYFYPRAGYIYADCLLLDSYFYVDIDNDNLRIAQKDTRKIIRHMNKKKEYILHMLQFSGSRGFHLIYKDLKKRKVKDPIRRIKYLKNRKKRLATELVKLGLKTIDKNHFNIMTDVFRVYSAPFSIKPNKNVVQPIPEDIFMQKDIYDIIPINCQIKGVHKPIEARADEAKVASQSYMGKQQDRLSSCPIHFKFMDNMINGLRGNYITIIKKHKDRFKVRDLNKLQEIYNLSDFYVVKIGNYIYCYNTKALQFERIVKIMRKAKSKNISYFLKRRHCPIQITPAIYENGDLANEIEYLGTLKSQYGLKDNHSRPHSKLFGLDYENLVGNESNNVGIMRVS